MIPILQAYVQNVDVPVLVEPIHVGASGDFGLLMFAVILAVIAAGIVAFMAHSKASALAMYRERSEERRQDQQIQDLKEKVADREHWLQHQIDKGQPFPGKGAS